MALTSAQLASVALLTKFSSSLALLGVMGIVLMYFIRREEFQTPMGRLILGMAFSDFIDASWKLVGRYAPDSGITSTICIAQTIGIQEGTLSSIFFTFCMCWMIVRSLMSSTPLIMTKRKELAIIGGCFLIPLPLSILPAVMSPPDGKTPLVADSDQWCWIKGGSYLPYQIVFFYGLFWFVFVFNIFSLIYTYYALEKLNANITDVRVKRKTMYIVRRMTAFLVAFLFAWTASNVNRMTSFALGSPVYELTMLQGFFSPARGFFNFLAFMYCYYTNPARRFNSAVTTFRSQHTDTKKETLSNFE
jgi:hypothetical protein